MTLAAGLYNEDIKLIYEIHSEVKFSALYDKKCITVETAIN